MLVASQNYGGLLLLCTDYQLCLLPSRLGVGVLVLVDCDVVSPSNVNRQVLFSREDVGRRKVDAALEGLARDNIQTGESVCVCVCVCVCV